MYYLCRSKSDTGLTVKEFHTEVWAIKEMEAEYSSIVAKEGCESTANNHYEWAYVYNPYEFGTVEWRIVGEPSLDESVLEKVAENYGKDFIESDEMAAFYIKNWAEFMCASEIDGYAWLNTILGYDIGANNASNIIGWLYEKFDSCPFDLPEGDDCEALLRVCKWDLGLDLDFGNFSNPMAIRYDW